MTQANRYFLEQREFWRKQRKKAMDDIAFFIRHRDSSNEAVKRITNSLEIINQHIQFYSNEIADDEVRISHQ